MMKRYALSAIGRDRPGIVAAVTKALYENDCNIEDSSMTILEDEFAIIMIMSAPDDADVSTLEAGLKEAEASKGLTITLKELPEESVVPPAPQANYIITLHGADKAGIVYKTSALLAGMEINITDLETKAVRSETENIYIMLLEVYVPLGVEVDKLEDELHSLGDEIGVTIKIKPVEDFEPL